MLKIHIVEDDPEQARWTEKVLRESFGQLIISRDRSESEFRANLWRLEEEPPDLVILDVIVRWAVPSPTMPARPPEVVNGGRFRAGVRCHELLRAAEALGTVPVIFYTVLDTRNLLESIQELEQREIIVVTKDAEGDSLIRAARSLLIADDKLDGHSIGMPRRLWNSLEAKIGAGGVSLDVKKFLTRKP